MRKEVLPVFADRLSTEEDKMFRCLTFFLAAVIASNAAVISEFVNCGGASQSITIHIPEQVTTPLECHQNGVTAISENFLGLIGFQIVAVPSPGNPQTPGNVQASFVETGNFVLDWEGGQITPHEPNPAFWAVCFNSSGSSINDGGSGSVSGSFGPGTLGAPCDFAHAVPFPVNGHATIPVDLSGEAEGNAILMLVAQPQFFDASGNSLGAVFGLTAIAEVPESFAFMPVSLILVLVVCWRSQLRRFLRMPVH